jgi:hypothetical protein
VSGQSVLDVGCVAVLGVGVVVCVDSHGGCYLGDGWGGVGNGCSVSSDGGGAKCSSEGGSRGQNSGGADDSGPGDGHNGSEDDELKIKAQLEIVIRLTRAIYTKPSSFDINRTRDETSRKGGSTTALYSESPGLNLDQEIGYYDFSQLPSVAINNIRKWATTTLLHIH